MSFDEIDLYIFDADGTLRRCTVRNRPTPHEDDEWELLPNVKERVQKILSRRPDVVLAIASNQGGIELGYLSKSKARKLLDDLYRELTGKHAPKGMIQLCPDYEKPSNCRKPKPGMLLKIMKQAKASTNKTLFVGNSEDDRLTAKNASVRFMWAKTFFGWNKSSGRKRQAKS
jgi:D-glycero-D-manno-heptose 1,7-bisphosphate phosphatase